jgi:hypothetical protein
MPLNSSAYFREPAGRGGILAAYLTSKLRRRLFATAVATLNLGSTSIALPLGAHEKFSSQI